MPGGREATRMMQKMGMQLGNIDNVTQVVIATETKRIIIDRPSVATLNMQGQQIYQVIGGQVKEETKSEAIITPEDDIRLVSEQAKVSAEEAKAALLRAGGDLAQAIVLLKENVPH